MVAVHPPFGADQAATLATYRQSLWPHRLFPPYCAESAQALSAAAPIYGTLEVQGGSSDEHTGELPLHLP
jgi:hypothetical protein